MPIYFHEDGRGQKHPYSSTDNRIIAAAKAQGAPSCRVSDVALPTGRVMRFEVRFGAGILSRKMHGPSPTGMVQVNIDDENTRVVHEQPDPVPAGGNEFVGGAAAAAGGGGVPSYFHEAPNGQREPFSAADNATIFAAQNQNLPSVRIADVTIAGGRVLSFEVRFGANAKSRKMPQPSPTGICQVNLGSENTRIVHRQDPPAQPVVANTGGGGSTLVDGRVVPNQPGTKPEWEEMKDPSGRSYYVNHRTKTTQWDRPAEMGPTAEQKRAQAAQHLQKGQQAAGDQDWAAAIAALEAGLAIPHADDGGNPVTHDCLHDLCLTRRRSSHRRRCVAGVAAAAE